MKKIMETLNYQPAGLTNAELENPYLVLSDFFQNHPLHDIRENIWRLYKGWVNYSSDFVDGNANMEMLFFYTQLLDFLNASYVYTKKQKLDIDI